MPRMWRQPQTRHDNKYTLIIAGKVKEINMATSKKTEEIIEIKAINNKQVKIQIVGDTPLIVHAWSEKAKRMMLEAQTKATKTKAREIRDPFDDFINSMYWLDKKPEESTPEAFDAAVKAGAKWGFPVGAIKMAGNSAAYRNGWVKNQMQLRGSYFLKTEWGDMAEIENSVPIMREDMVRVGMGSADLRYRGEFRNWSMKMTLEYNADGELTLEQIINVINAGGYSVGIGEWRPEKDGDFGRYHIEV